MFSAMGHDYREDTTIMEYTQTIDPTDFWSWKKIEAGHYVLTTDTRYTATVRKGRYSGWTAEAASPSGTVRGEDVIVEPPRECEVCGAWSHHKTMADAKRWVLKQIDVLVQQDETELLANALRHRSGSVGAPQRSEVVMSPLGQSASFTVEGDAVHRSMSPGGVHYTYKVTVERWDG